MAARKRVYGPKLVIWSTFLPCAATSVMFNVVHTLTVSHVPAAIWTAAMWSILAVGGWEMVVRAPWGRGRLSTLIRYGGVSGAAIGAMWISYWHARAVLRSWGESPSSAAIGPVIIDLLLIVSAAALLALHTRRTPVRSSRAVPRKARPRLKAA